MSSEVTLDDRAQALENEYFRRREQELIEKMRAKLQAEAAQATTLQCPKCEGTLVESDFENVKVDICNNCHGVWLDAGELAQIAHHEENKGSWFGRWF
ncbi:MAG: zf-TFIIB domain-containing protein [Acidobacteriota bacterium]|nr:zf-TFIIB domain-containing protein [Acidobacteriota bacterium]